MSHWYAMRRCIGKNGEDIAEELGQEYSTVRRWTRPYEGPTDSGSRGPGDKLHRIIRKSLELGTRPEDAFAPLDEIETLLGRVCIETIPFNKPINEITEELGKTMEETGQALSVAAKGLSNKSLSSCERERIIKESKEALREWATFIMYMERAGK